MFRCKIIRHSFLFSCTVLLLVGFGLQQLSLQTQIAQAHPNLYLPISVHEALLDDPKQKGFQLQKGVQRKLEPVTFGIPIDPDSTFDKPSQFLLIGVKEAQFRIVNNWRTQKAKWIIIDTQVSINAGKRTDDLFLTLGKSPLKPNLAKEDSDRISINTGPAQFTIHKKNFNLFEKVVVKGKVLIASGNQSGIYLIDQNGKIYSSRNDPSPKVQIEENGSLRTVIRIHGKHVSKEGKVLLSYTIRMHFYKNKTRCRMFYTLQNASKRSPKNQPFRSLSIRLDSTLTQADYSIATHEHEQKGKLQASQSLHLVQNDNNSPAFFDQGFEQKQKPTQQKGYTLSLDKKPLKQGSEKQPIPLFYAQLRKSNTKSIIIGSRFAAWIWPQGLQLNGNGSATVEIFPEEKNKLHSIQFYTHQTRELFFHFSEKTVAPREHFFRFQYPLIARAKFPAWYNTSEALSEKLLSFQKEAKFLENKKWPFDGSPRSTKQRRPTFSAFRYLNWSLQRFTDGYDPGRLQTYNFLRETQKHAGTYYLLAEQIFRYHADRSIQRSDDFNFAKAKTEAPKLLHSSGRYKTASELAGASSKVIPHTHFTTQNPHGYGLALWSHLTGNTRIANAYTDWLEVLESHKPEQTKTKTRTYAWQLFNLVQAHLETGKKEQLDQAWKLLQSESEPRDYTKRGYGTNWQRGYFLSSSQKKDKVKKVNIREQGAMLLRAYAALYELFRRDSRKFDPKKQDPKRADLIRDLLEGLSRFIGQEAWIGNSEKPKEYGVPFEHLLFKKPPNDPRKSKNWNGGFRPIFLSQIYAYLLSGDKIFKETGELLQKAVAYNVGQGSGYQDLPDRQTHIELLNNIEIYEILRPLPFHVSNRGKGKYLLTWKTPVLTAYYVIKYSEKPIVSWLGFDTETQTFLNDPKKFTPFFAAHNVQDEPKPLDAQDLHQYAIQLDASKKYYFAIRYASSVPLTPQPIEASDLPDGGVIETPPRAEKPEDKSSESSLLEKDQGSDGSIPPEQQREIIIEKGCGCQSDSNRGQNTLLIGLIGFLLLSSWHQAQKRYRKRS